MKTLKSILYILIITLLVFNIQAYVIYRYPDDRKIKRDDTPPAANGVNGAGDQQNPQPQTEAVPETTKVPEVPVVATTTPPAAPEPVATTTQPTAPAAPTTPTENKQNDEDKNPKKEDQGETKPTTKGSETNGTSESTPDNTSNTSGTNTSNSNTNNDGNNKTGKTDTTTTNNTNNTNKKDDEGGLSGGIIAVIVIGGIFALGVVILIFRSLLKLCNKKEKEYPIPVLNVVSNHDSSEQLNPQAKMSQDAMGESGYYNQSTSTIPNTEPMVAINESPQYYQSPPPPQPQYDNGVDISNQYQQSQDGYQEGYVEDLRVNSVNSGGVANDYPLPQQEVIQPIRNYSSLRRPNATSGMPEMPLEGYDNPSMMNGEITDAAQKPHKVIINKTNNTPIEPGTIHKAQFPFNPNMDDELKLNSGDAVEIIEVYDDGWSYGKNMVTNEIGVFPISYITGYNDPTNNF